MFLKMFQGFCMALADSGPGVSGGMIAFVIGFYDDFIGAIHDVLFASVAKKKQAALYLVKLGCGWIVGMGLAACILSSLFERHIYLVSSLFIGFILGSIPFVIGDEFAALKNIAKGWLFLLLGVLFVVGITYLNRKVGSQRIDLNQLSLPLIVRLFLVGMIAISAMFLPGISGSTILLIFGCSIPVIHAIKNILALHFNTLPALMIFGIGILFGAISVVKLIQFCLEKYRTQTMYLILGMMLGSLIAIWQGPCTLALPQPALSLQSFHLLSALFGMALVLGLHKLQ